jgi:hypothetical protein
MRISSPRPVPRRWRVRKHAEHLSTWAARAIEIGRNRLHPFGPVFRGLIEVRGLSVRQAARRSLRAASSINRLPAGNLIPHPALVADVARALDMSIEDLAVIAGLNPADPGRA